MKVNLFEVKDEYSYESNWWKHIRSSNFGFCEHVQDLASYEVDENDILYLNQRAPEGYFEKYWFIATDMGVERTDLSEVKEVLTKSLVEFVRVNEKLPYKCSITKRFKNNKVQVNYEPNEFDKVIMKLSPGEFGIEDVQDYFDVSDFVENNPADSIIVKKRDVSSHSKPKPKSKKLSLFPAGKRAVIHRGKIKIIQKKERKYEEKIYYQYILHLINGTYALEGENEEDFDEFIIQISEGLYDKMNPEVGDTIYCKGRTKNDWTYGDIVHNIRTLKIL